MKNKVLGMILAVAMTAGIVSGCGGTTASSDANADSAGTVETSASAGVSDEAAKETSEAAKKTDDKQLFIGVTFPTVANDFAVALRDGTINALEAAGCKVQFDSADGDVTAQANQVENDITLGCDAIVVWPVNGDGIASTVKNAVDAGVEVLGFANAIPTATANNVAATDGDMGKALAQMAGDWIDQTYADAGDGDVTVLCITASNTPQAIERSDAMKTIQDNSKVKMITADVDWDSPDQSRQLVENQLLANPDIDVILTPGNTPGIAANNYVMSSSSPIKDKSKFAVFTVDETEEVTSAIKASENNEAVLRGTISMGSIDNTINQLMKSVQPFIDGGDMADVKGDATVVTADTLK